MARGHTVCARASACLALFLLHAAGAWAQEPKSAHVHIIGNDRACPTPYGVAAVLQPLLVYTTVTPTISSDVPPDGVSSRIVQLIDLGPSFRVSLSSAERQFTDSERRCEERARQAAVFIALVVEPPLVPLPPSPPPSPVPPPPTPKPPLASSSLHRPLRLDLEVSGLMDMAPRTSLFSGGAALRMALGKHHVGVSFGIAGLSPATLKFEQASATITRVVLDLALRGYLDIGRISLVGDLGVAGTVLIVEGASGASRASSNNFEWGIFASVMIEVWAWKRVAPFLALQTVVVPKPAELALYTKGVVGKMPYAWFGVALGLAIKLN